MYEELLNFLLAKKKRLLSEEETDRLMELIAKSMGLDENFREQTDSKALIKKILDNVDVEEVDTSESDSVREAVDDLFFDGDSSDMMQALSDSEEGRDMMLSEKKFKRGEFKGCQGDGVINSEKKKMVGIIQKSEVDGNDEMAAKEAMEEVDEMKREFKLPGFEVNKEKQTKDIDASIDDQEEFWFDIGNLKKVRKFGSDVKFFDEEGKEL
ncbi:hypothetical protein CWI42_091040 [Ordospora colligata]|uniref:Uncharacterized protein n=1 Tax=Ordospora colligata OC4 TaxID=1354746 RepID=A0A0B2UJF0_9MICR|nr:uncharacterized protein M896_091050 [Ordospora colligata OC4]KHN69177.1 hypothetical protein M896_091050 [Ordospora colligata OC4]TBU14632.1 hypothetical protein CWI41_091040 [Ordospora colligata]TBU18018.1 hypothetical protein CWI42_091040 [Ordospora colligata]